MCMVCCCLMSQKYFFFPLFCIGMENWKPMRIRNGIMVMVTFMAMVREWVWGSVEDYESGYNFNGMDHDALCAVFQASADLWNASRNSDRRLTKGLEKYLGQSLFGNTGSRNLEAITDALPKEYNNHKISQRGVLCGTCKYREQPHYPGKSIPHDLMCLCTPGKYGEPFYGYWFFGLISEDTGFKLCGKEKTDMVNNNHDGWYEDGKKKGKKGLEKPWKAVIWGCLNQWKNKVTTESQDLAGKVNKLIETMKNFTTVVKESKGRSKLGGMHDHHTASDGKDEKSMHVHYDTCRGIRKPWWKKLNETLNGKNPEALLVDRSTTTPSEEGMEDTDGESEFLEEVENTESEGPTPLAGSALQSNNGTQIQGPTNSTESTVTPLNTSATGNSSHPRLEYLRSGSQINQPLLFPSAIFLT
ncbi:Variant surface glycoprotein [Trypanosoma congolense IL3000]|uniref:Variant surface glycoprotein n=1 Tax=Trypanosoma congolense (strain IL3000) TaxID=1068625 RepID=F9WDI6_TRYCI|nr:Variant surface glycoprotein [Trypanosoma congolense IL3000]